MAFQNICKLYPTYLIPITTDEDKKTIMEVVTMEMISREFKHLPNKYWPISKDYIEQSFVVLSNVELADKYVAFYIPKYDLERFNKLKADLNLPGYFISDIIVG